MSGLSLKCLLLVSHLFFHSIRTKSRWITLIVLTWLFGKILWPAFRFSCLNYCLNWVSQLPIFDLMFGLSLICLLPVSRLLFSTPLGLPAGSLSPFPPLLWIASPAPLSHASFVQFYLLRSSSNFDYSKPASFKRHFCRLMVIGTIGYFWTLWNVSFTMPSWELTLRITVSFSFASLIGITCKIQQVKTTWMTFEENTRIRLKRS